jgi:hypothetical protein
MENITVKIGLEPKSSSSAFVLLCVWRHYAKAKRA